MIAARTEIRGADVARHYDELDRFYRDIWGDHVHHGLWLRGDETRDEAVRSLVDIVAAEADVQRGSRLIDIGCGYGATARLLAAEFGAEVTGITISGAQHAIASFSSDRGAVAEPRFLLGDWLTNDLPAGYFDVALAIESSEHMPDKAAFFRQACRVLRPGGRLVVCAWLSRETATARERRWLLEPIAREGRMPQIGAESDYRLLAAEAKFRVDKFQDVTSKISRTWPMIVRTFLWNLARQPGYIRFILDPRSGNAVFALTIFRLWIAFRTGAMRYGIFTLSKCGEAQAGSEKPAAEISCAADCGTLSHV